MLAFASPILYLCVNSYMDKETKGTIQTYRRATYSGDLDLSHGRVIGMAKYAAELFLDSPVQHFVSTFLYFYHVAPKLENPVTVSAWGDSITVHPGQGRLLASYFRKDKTIPALLIPLHQSSIEDQLLNDVSYNMKPFNKKVYTYKSAYHDGVSTSAFKKYFHPTETRLEYENEKINLLSNLVTDVHGTIEWRFKDRNSLKLGSSKSDVIIECDAEGFYESVAHLAFNDFNESNKFKII